MMEKCYRCSGYVALQYDAGLRCYERYCVNCGARPEFKRRRADGQPEEGPMLCRKCGIYPRAKIGSYRNGEVEISMCTTCRVVELSRKRLFDKAHQRPIGAVRHKGALLA